jgi:hypothetical protein
VSKNSKATLPDNDVVNSTSKFCTGAVDTTWRTSVEAGKRVFILPDKKTLSCDTAMLGDDL